MTPRAGAVADPAGGRPAAAAPATPAASPAAGSTGPVRA